MATLQVLSLSFGYSTQDLVRITKDINSFSNYLWTQPPHYESVYNVSAFSVASNLPINEPGYTIDTARTISYFDDFFFRVYVVPSNLELGNLLSAQVHRFGLWNAWLDDTTVESVTSIGLDGMEVEPPPDYSVTPFTLRANQEITYSLSISLTGSPTVNAKIFWNTNRNDVSLSVTGSRVVLFPFKPDWKDGIDETISTRSVLTRTSTGSEQAISLRDKDRRSYSAKYVFGNLDSQRFDNLMFGWQSRFYGVPLWFEESYITDSIESGSFTVSVGTTGRTLVPGGLLLVYDDDPWNSDVREIQSITSTEVTVTVPFNRNWDKGSRIVPAAMAQVSAEVSSTRYTSQASSVNLSWDFEPSSTDPNMPDEPPVALYRGEEMYLGRTNWRDPLSVNSNSDVRRIDFSTGRFGLKSLSGFSGQGRSHDWFMPTINEVRALRAWLKRRRGRTHGVWMPSGFQDFTVIQPSVASEILLRVASNGYGLLVAEHPARRDVYIRFTDDTFITRRIVGSNDDPSGAMTTLTLDQPLGRDIAPSSVKQFSFLAYYRMASDDTQLHWHQPGIAEATTGLISTKSLT